MKTIASQSGRNRTALLVACALLIAGVLPGAAQDSVLHLGLRSRIQPFKGSDAWREVRLNQDFPAAKTAIIICDMWDKHWCTDAAQRVQVLARKMAPVIDAAREHGILIIHAPSETMDFHKDSPQRQRMLALAKIDPPPGLNLTEPPLPIDDTDGGCQTPGDKEHAVWTRENAALVIHPEDVISDNGQEIYSLLRQRGIENVMYMGVHTNMCILDRSFAIRQMSKWGFRCVLVRDLTDTMYNPARRPFVPHDKGTELVLEHIEKYWCPTTSSGDLMRALGEMR